MVGEETLFPGAKSIGGLDDLQDITNTIMLVERYTPNWMDPTQEISYETACKGINKDVFGVGSFHPGGTNVGFADGSVRFLENDEDLTPYLKAKKLK